MFDNFDLMRKGATTPEAKAAVEELWEMYKNRGSAGCKYMGVDGFFTEEELEAKKESEDEANN